VGSYNITAATFNALAGSSAGNYNVPTFTTANSPALTITKASLTGSLTTPAQSIVYGQNDPLLSSMGVTLNFINNPTISTWNGNVSVNDTGNVNTTLASLTRAVGENVGSYNITAASFTALTGSAIGNYNAPTFGTANNPALTITPATLTYTSDVTSSVYGNTLPSLTGSISGFVLGENLGSATTGSATFTTLANNTSNVGSYAINGSGLTANNGNYIFVQAAPNATALTITQRILNLSGSRIYDATANFSAAQLTASNIVNGDTVNLGGTSAVASKNTGTYTSLASNSLTSSNANYTTVGGSVSAIITPYALTISASGINKVYDAGTGATVNLSDNRFSGDVLSTSYGAASFADKNVANGKAVSVIGLGLTGTDAANYTFNNTASTTANITPYALTISASGINKVYDAGTGATVNLSDNRLGSDVLSTSYGAASFADKNVANGKAVSVIGLGLTGADAANYTFNNTASTTANITPYALTISASGVNKVYDAGTGATVNLSDNRLGSDVLNTSYGAASFADKNVANGKAVSVIGLGLSGTDAGNYTFNNTASTTANITPYALTIAGVSATNKVYDATTVDSLNVGLASLSGVFAGDAVALGSGTGSFADKNVGIAKVVTATGFTLSGTDATNYTVAQPASLSANITPAPLTVTADAQTKTYGTNDPSLTYTTTGLFAGDSVTGNLNRAISSATENVGAYAILQNNLAASSNYTLSYVSNNLTITPAMLTVNANPASKISGAADPVFTYNASGFINKLVDGITIADNTNNVLMGLLARQDNSEAAGNYTITQGSLVSNNNYSMIYTPAIFTINAAPTAGQVSRINNIVFNTVSIITGADGSAQNATTQSVLSTPIKLVDSDHSKTSAGSTTDLPLFPAVPALCSIRGDLDVPTNFSVSCK
ncbi:MAG: YDG domain-containing protein, partial [Gammaproteobacteria bacterium]|nr:YDG domain-containing protein [Gammaproteobacteria bacterium]